MLKLSIKSYIIIFLLLLAAAGIYGQKDLMSMTLQIAIAVIAAVALDWVINSVLHKKNIFPSSAVISGLIVGMVLATGQNILLVILASAFAILSKHLIKLKNKHIFNPANLGLLLINIFFGASMGWWQVNIWLIILGGFFIVYKVRRWHIAASFLLALSVLLIIYSYLKQGGVLDYFPVINLYFAFVMLIEPKTSPVKMCRGIVFGALVGIISFLIFLAQLRIDYLLVSLAIGNILNSVMERINKC